VIESANAAFRDARFYSSWILFVGMIPIFIMFGVWGSLTLTGRLGTFDREQLSSPRSVELGPVREEDESETLLGNASSSYSKTQLTGRFRSSSFSNNQNSTNTTTNNLSNSNNSEASLRSSSSNSSIGSVTEKIVEKINQ
jgi:hypothetical protein